MKHKVIVNFKDGPKEVSVGDKFYSISHRRNGVERTITSIGRKYITGAIIDRSSTYGERQFFIENGREHSDYRGEDAYSSEAAYLQSIKES